ncbi:hypothetical protein B0H11DRAFT_1340711 [Mycena galericulata]|nr:hypothetical protein B0H11DRAFT_1340711 [Mycena galericulata]
MSCQFSFGPNRSYFCGAKSVYAWSENVLPAGLARLLEDRKHPQAIDIPYDVGLPMESGTYTLYWRTTKGEDWYEDECLGPNYGRLARFIKGVASKGGRTSRTTFGPSASYFSISPSGYSWQNIPLALEDDIQNCMKIRRPTCVALGVQGSYVVLYNDKFMTFDLRGQYPLVEAMLRNTQEVIRRSGIVYVALNSFVAGEYYAVYGDGSALWNFPTAWAADVTAISREIRPVARAGSAAAPGGTTPTQSAKSAPAWPADISPPAYVPPTSTVGAPSPNAGKALPPHVHKVRWQEGFPTDSKRQQFDCNPNL